MKLFYLAILLCCAAQAANEGGAPPFDAKTAAREFLAENDWGKSARMTITWRVLPTKAKLALIEELASKLDSTEQLDITNTGDMTVDSRVASGQMTPMVEGDHPRQDVFIVGGKTAWAIERLVGATAALPILEKMADNDRAAAMFAVKQLAQAYRNGVTQATAER